MAKLAQVDGKSTVSPVLIAVDSHLLMSKAVAFIRMDHYYGLYLSWTKKGPRKRLQPQDVLDHQQ